MSSIIEFDTKADALSLFESLNSKLREMSGNHDLLFTSLRQPRKVEYNFWLFNDPRDKYIGQYKRELDAILDASSITFRVKSLPYEHDYTREEDAFYGQTLGYN